MVDLYGRDSVASAIRELARVIGLARKGDFNPDSTRSGFFRHREMEAGEQLVKSRDRFGV